VRYQGEPGNEVGRGLGEIASELLALGFFEVLKALHLLLLGAPGFFLRLSLVGAAFGFGEVVLDRVDFALFLGELGFGEGLGSGGGASWESLNWSMPMR
jgi:hypothetical protein